MFFKIFNSTEVSKIGYLHYIYETYFVVKNAVFVEDRRAQCQTSEIPDQTQGQT